MKIDGSNPQSQYARYLGSIQMQLSLNHDAANADQKEIKNLQDLATFTFTKSVPDEQVLAALLLMQDPSANEWSAPFIPSQLRRSVLFKKDEDDTEVTIDVFDSHAFSIVYILVVVQLSCMV